MIVRSIPLLTILATVALAATAHPAAAQRQPAPAPVASPRACPDCQGDDTLRARAEELRTRVEQRYDEALEALDAMRQADDSATHAAYAQATRAYEESRHEYANAVNRLMRAEMEQMRGQLDSLRRAQYERVPKGYIGVTFSASYKMVGDSGRTLMKFSEYPVIESVEPDSPADKGGVESRDVLIAIAGQDVTKGVPPFGKLLTPGNHLALQVKRGKSTLTRVIVVEKRPDDWMRMKSSMAPMAPMTPMADEGPEPPEGAWRTPMPPSAMVAPRAPGELSVQVYYDNATVAGAQLQQFQNLKEYFGADTGVLVLRVLPGTPAARAGLKGGDVIMRAGGRTVTTPLQFSRLLSRANGSSLPLEIMRQRKKETLVLKW
jgi:C-terminal processing protease CtpA/Prc